jgi:hypothetical protein
MEDVQSGSQVPWRPLPDLLEGKEERVGGRQETGLVAMTRVPQ